MTVQNVSGDAKSGFGEDLGDSVNEPETTDVPDPDAQSDGDSEPDPDNPGADQPADPASEGDNPAH